MIRNTPLLYSAVFIVNVLFMAPGYAEQENDDSDIGGEYVEPEAWKEDEVVIPPYPKQDDLIPVDLDRAEMPFDFYIDAKNLRVSPNSGVIRYTVLIESNSGAKNVLFEGIRCDSREFRTYAYGTYDGKLVKAQTSNWDSIRDSGFMIHRYGFYRHYMCSEYRNPHPVETVLQKIKYPENFQVPDEYDD